MKVEAYAGLALALTWVFWLPAVAVGLGWLPAASPWLVLLGYTGPALAALCVVAGSASGVGGMLVWLDEVMDPRADLRWYALAVGLPLGIFGLAVPLSVAWTGTVPAFEGLIRPAATVPEVPLALAVVLHLLVVGVFGELGWRGYLLGRLQRDFSAVTASAHIAAVWTVWQLPTLFFEPGWDGFRNGAVRALAALPLTVLATWLYNGSGGRVLVTALFVGVSTLGLSSSAAVGPLGALMVFGLGGLALLVTRVHGAADLTPSGRRVQMARQHQEA